MADGKPCPTAARDKTDFCVTHGGGKRCAAKIGNGDPCPASAVGKTDFCVTHGGGIRCPNCINWIDSRGGSAKYDGYCATCFKRVFPTDPRSTIIYEHTKEIRVRNMINAHFTGFIHDVPLHLNGCSCAHKRRVDHRCLIEGVMLAVETDEFAHRGYTDEDNRYEDLAMASTGKWIFIRFNPDGKGVDLEDKLVCLKAEMEKQIERITSGERDQNEDLVEIVFMYY
jgi:hypothetical protein